MTDVAAPQRPAQPLLQAEELRVQLANDGPVLLADCTLDIAPGETLGLVGESGSGKTMFGRAVMGLLPANAEVSARRFRLAGRDLLTIAPDDRRRQRGGTVAMVFQDPMTSLNPFVRLRAQLGEMLPGALDRDQRDAKISAALRDVGLADPQRCADAFPHELSGGMRQRALIAMMLLGAPALLIADEPTTALDVTVAARILELFAGLARRHDLAILLISHDIAAVGSIADRIAVMYAGEVVEVASTAALLTAPKHPYTEALLASRPAAQPVGPRLRSIPGFVPAAATTSGCAFAARCAYVAADCRASSVSLSAVSVGEHGGEAAVVRCLHPLDGGTR